MAERRQLFNSMARIVDGKIFSEKPAWLIKEIISSGFLTKEQVLSVLGVQEGQLYRVAKSVDNRTLKTICRMALGRE